MHVYLWWWPVDELPDHPLNKLQRNGLVAEMQNSHDWLPGQGQAGVPATMQDPPEMVQISSRDC